MHNTVTVTLTREEQLRLLTVLRDAAAFPEADSALHHAIEKLADAGTGPKVTIGVHGGMVQWIIGNPFPIRICDYDGSRNDYTHIDEREQGCIAWYEPVDTDWPHSKWSERPANQTRR